MNATFVDAIAYEQLFDSLPLPLVLTDAASNEFRLVQMNRKAMELFGIFAIEANGQPVAKLLDLMGWSDCIEWVDRAAADGKYSYKRGLVGPEERIWDMHLLPRTEIAGTPPCILMVFIEKTEDLREKQQLLISAETAMHEINHRIKNNLAAIAGLLELEMGEKRAHIPKDVTLRNAVGRIRAIAAVHELLYAQDIREVDVREIVERIVRAVESHLVPASSLAKFTIEGESARLGSREATSLALILNELLSNSVKHALSRRPAGRVMVKLTPCDSSLQLEIRDDGPGFPADFELKQNGSLGLRLVDELVRYDLNGSWEMQNDPGAVVTLRLPLPRPVPNQKFWSAGYAASVNSGR
jgi:two-component sensor histidine kinase